MYQPPSPIRSTIFQRVIHVIDWFDLLDDIQVLVCFCFCFNRLICASNDEMTGACKKLFLRPHYHYEIKVHLNNKAFEKFGRTSETLCEVNRITFRTMPEKFPKDRSELMFPCFGRHSTIRTHFEMDDYLKKFYLSYFPGKKIYFVFLAERHGSPEIQYTFYEQIHYDSWQRLALKVGDFIDGLELLREKVLNTIDFHNYWQREIENIFVNEMIANPTQKP